MNTKKPINICIIGANGLIGCQLVMQFIAADYNIIACDVSFNNLQKLSLDANLQNKLSYIKTNVIDEENVKELFYLKPEIKHIINLCYPKNQAYGNKLEDVSANNFSENVSMNLTAYFNILKHGCIHFKKTNSGSIINFSSIYGVIAPKFEIYDDTSMTMPIEYAPIKSGIIHMSMYFAKYYLKNQIRINCISPGGVLNAQDQKFLREYNKHTNGNGMLDPSDFFKACEFLLFNETITGQNLIIDNGFSL
jgi:NAD(P)-dependent dehydrogenase (short-subunit alcohol dehydrogenase family)